MESCEIHSKSVTWVILACDNDQWKTYEPGSEMMEIVFTS